ncbi:hypothetical protein PN789_002759 [Enterobacter hormaechei]|nr:hypothetical protein [Enterobacter hormaechei]
MSNIDKHAVQAVADLKAGYTLGHADVAILNELARIALASLEAEAMTQVLSSRAGNDTSTIDKAMPEGTMLYTAPPAPVSVPDLKALEAILNWILMLPCPTPKATHFAKRLSVVIDACRAGMLQGAAGGSPVIQDGWDMATTIDV